MITLDDRTGDYWFFLRFDGRLLVAEKMRPAEGYSFDGLFYSCRIGSDNKDAYDSCGGYVGTAIGKVRDGLDRKKLSAAMKRRGIVRAKKGRTQ